MSFTVFYSLGLSQDLLIGGVLEEGEAGGDTTSVFSTLTQTRNLPHSGWYPQTERSYHERPINVKPRNKVRNLA